MYLDMVMFGQEVLNFELVCVKCELVFELFSCVALFNAGNWPGPWSGVLLFRVCRICVSRK